MAHPFIYGSLLRQFWLAALAKEMEYRLNFAFAALASLANLVGSIFYLSLFFQGDRTLPGWNWSETLLVLGFFTILQGFASALLAPNLNSIVKHVERGTLDFVLLKPISSQFWLSSYTLSPWGIPDLCLGFGLVIYSAIHLGLPWYQGLLSLIPLSCGAAILYSLWFMLGTTSIWFTKIYNVTAVLRGLLEAGRFPMAAYPLLYRIFFTFIIPIAFLTTVPSQVLLGQTSPGWFFGAIVLAIALLYLSHRFWHFALGSYTSASS